MKIPLVYLVATGVLISFSQMACNRTVFCENQASSSKLSVPVTKNVKVTKIENNNKSAYLVAFVFENESGSLSTPKVVIEPKKMASVIMSSNEPYEVNVTNELTGNISLKEQGTHLFLWADNGTSPNAAFNYIYYITKLDDGNLKYSTTGMQKINLK